MKKSIILNALISHTLNSFIIHNLKIHSNLPNYLFLLDLYILETYLLTIITILFYLVGLGTL